MALYLAPQTGDPMGEAAELQKEMLGYFKRKKVPIRLLRQPEQLETLAGDPTAAVFCGDDGKTQFDWIRRCNEAGVPVIAAAFPHRVAGVSYCSIELDPERVMRRIADYCYQYGKRHVAFFGVNPYNQTDTAMASALFRILPGMRRTDFFYNTGSLTPCFEAFYAVRHRYDAVLAVNDIAAASLQQALRTRDGGYWNDRFLISFSDDRLAEFCVPSLTSVTYDRVDLMQAVMTTYRVLVRHPGQFDSFSLTLKAKIAVRESTQNRPPLPCTQNEALLLPRTLSYPTQRTEPALYLDDPFTQASMRLALLLRHLDSIDAEILLALLDGESNERIGERLFLTVRAVLYRITRMTKLVGLQERREIIDLVRENLDRERLTAYFQTLTDADASEEARAPARVEL